MKGYGIKIEDLPRDCTATGKYGSDKMIHKCSCGKKHAKKTSDIKSRKAKERQKNKIKDLDN